MKDESETENKTKESAYVYRLHNWLILLTNDKMGSGSN